MKFLQLEASHDREKELLHDITELQWRYLQHFANTYAHLYTPTLLSNLIIAYFGMYRLIRVQDELQKNRTENAQVNFQ